MDGRFNGIDIAVLVAIMVIVLMARFGGWRGWRPPGGPLAR